MQNVSLKQENTKKMMLKANNCLNINRCSDTLPENRCKVCNRLLFLGKVEYVEIKCPKCNCIAKFSKNKIK